MQYYHNTLPNLVWVHYWDEQLLDLLEDRKPILHCLPPVSDPEIIRRDLRSLVYAQFELVHSFTQATAEEDGLALRWFSEERRRVLVHGLVRTVSCDGVALQREECQRLRESAVRGVVLALRR